ncbi:EamA family transporter [Halorubellus sp. PRR65]|uniref:EamA family transporter n=1 Tax=Halorubellus sp. PRR65 TaxID=3098148 RepID=UPI002B25B907|nr:EamA family transporter [Halorubellus sp. PRR65]
MSSLGVALALAGAVVFGTYIFLVKYRFGHYPDSVYVVCVYAIATVLYAPVAVASDATVPTDPYTLAVLVAVAALGGVAILAFFRALTLGDVSYVAPVSKVVPLFVLPIELALIPATSLSVLQVAGVLVVTIALYLANYQGDFLTPLRRAVTLRPGQLALASAATFGVVDVGKRHLMGDLGVDPAAFVAVLFPVVAVTFAPLAARQWPADVTVRDDLGALAALAVLVAVGQHVVAVAFVELAASVASPLVNAQAIVAVVLGGVVLNEPRFRARLAAAGLAVAGVACIALG